MINTERLKLADKVQNDTAVRSKEYETRQSLAEIELMYERVNKIKVNCGKCHKWIDEDDTEFVDKETNYQGVDMLTFICPVCKTVQKSILVKGK